MMIGDETLFSLPELKEPETIDELNRQLADLTDAIGRCEKMLQHLAMENMMGHSWGSTSHDESPEFDQLMSQHIHLIALRNDREQKRRQLIEQKNAVQPPQ